MKGTTAQKARCAVCSTAQLQHVDSACKTLAMLAPEVQQPPHAIGGSCSHGYKAHYTLGIPCSPARSCHGRMRRLIPTRLWRRGWVLVRHHCGKGSVRYAAKPKPFSSSSKFRYIELPNLQIACQACCCTLECDCCADRQAPDDESVLMQHMWSTITHDSRQTPCDLAKAMTDKATIR